MSQLFPEPRNIEYEYYILRASDDVSDLRRASASLLAMQSTAAQRSHDLLRLTADSQALQQSALSELRLLGQAAQLSASSLRSIEESNWTVAEEAGAIAANTSAILQSTQEMATNTWAIRQALGNIAEMLDDERQLLRSAASALERPYETQALEIRRQADKWLTAGIRSARIAEDRAAYWDDALRLYRQVADNPIGRQDWLVWFNLGWLYWKHRHDLAAAGAAFDRSRLLAIPSSPSHNRLALRHLAYIQYLQGASGSALETMKACLRIERCHDDLYDAARYAARSGDTRAASEMLVEAIEMQPLSAVTAFSERDFTESDFGLAETIAALTTRLREDTRSAIASSRQEHRDREESTPSISIGLPEWSTSLEELDYSSLVPLWKRVLADSRQTAALWARCSRILDLISKRRNELAVMSDLADSEIHIAVPEWPSRLEDPDAASLDELEACVRASLSHAATQAIADTRRLRSKLERDKQMAEAEIQSSREALREAEYQQRFAICEECNHKADREIDAISNADREYGLKDNILLVATLGLSFHRTLKEEDRVWHAEYDRIRRETNAEIKRRLAEAELRMEEPRREQQRLENARRAEIELLSERLEGLLRFEQRYGEVAAK